MKQLFKYSYTAQWGTWFTLILLLAVFGTARLYAQELYGYKGFIAQHPYFENKTFLTEQNRVDILASRRFLDSSPTAISYTSAGVNVAGVYISGDSLYSVTSTVSINTCTCCKNMIQFTAPRVISSLPLPVDSTTSLYIIRNRSVDTINVFISNHDGTIHRITINMSTFAISGSSAIILSNAAGKTITSIAGTSSGFATPDSGIWITGSGGMIRFLSYTQSTLQGEINYDIAGTETVLCYGDGYAATASGKIYQHASTGQFNQVADKRAAIRSIDRRSASGDGIVLINKTGGWEEIYTGPSMFRAHNLTANAYGVLCEVIDDRWRCDTIIDGNTETVMRSFQPASYIQYVNNKIPYVYNDDHTEIVTIMLGDPEENFQPPSFIHKSGMGKVQSLNSDGIYTLRNADPSLFCSNGNLSLADSMIKVLLSPKVVSIEAFAKLGSINLVCEECVLKDYLFSKSVPWVDGDTLLIKTSSQNFKVVNLTSSVSNVDRVINSIDRHILYINTPAANSLRIAVPFNPAYIETIIAYNLLGKKIPVHYGGNGTVHIAASCEVITFQIQLTNGMMYTVRSVMTTR